MMILDKLWLPEGVFVVLGWLGFILCSAAYLLLNLKVLNFDHAFYQLLNIFGGLGLVLSALYFNDGPNLAANAVWVCIALFGFIRYSKRRLRRRRTEQIGEA